MADKQHVEEGAPALSMEEFQRLFSGEQSKEKTEKFYNKYAKDYEKVILGTPSDDRPYERVGRHAAELLSENKASKILDIGAGTGLLGCELHQRGFHNIDALDVSAEMMEVAKEKKIYCNYICDYLGPNKLEINDDTYDAIVGSGTFSHGQAKQDCFKELIRITKKGGYIVFGVRENALLDLPDWDSVIKYHEEKNNWENVYKKILDNYHVGTKGIIYAFKKV